MNDVQAIRRLFVAAIVAGLASASGGCVGQHWPAKLEDLGNTRVPIDADGIDVALAEVDRARIDSWIDRYEPTRRSVYTGPAWAKVFRGDPARRPVFKITSSAILEDDIVDAHRITYVVDGTLSFGGHDYLIHAQGRAVTSQWPSRAIPPAVGNCVLDAARQAANIVAVGHDAEAPTGDSHASGDAADVTPAGRE